MLYAMFNILQENNVNISTVPVIEPLQTTEREEFEEFSDALDTLPIGKLFIILLDLTMTYTNQFVF